MEEIRIYHSTRKCLAMAVCCFVFVGCGVCLLLKEPTSFVNWVGTLFAATCCLIIIYPVVRERITNKPYYLITDERIFVDSGLKQWEVSFTDVEEFCLLHLMSSQQIGIKYKKTVEHKKMNDSGCATRTLRKMNKKIAGVQESLPCDGLTMKAQQLCELLNKRLKA